MARALRRGLTAAALVAALLAAAMGGAAAAERTKVTTALGGDGLLFVMHHLALGGGFFAEEGLDVEAVDVGSGPRQAAALMGGSSEFTSLGFIHVLKSIVQGGNLVALGIGLNMLDIQLVLSNEAVAKSGITPALSVDERVNRLKGLKVAITTPGSTTDTWIRSLLKARGHDADSFLTVQALAGGNPMLAALTKKATDGFVWGPPQSHMAVAQGVGRIVVDPFTDTIPEIAGVPYIVIITSRDTLQKKPHVLRAAVRAFTKAMKFAKDDPAGARKIIRKDFPDIDEAIFDATWKNYVKAIPTTPMIPRETFEKTQAWLNITANPPVKLPYETAFYDGFAKEAAAEILGK
jgi:NitT/TauT family transport system substrate-binding protein